MKKKSHLKNYDVRDAEDSSPEATRRKKTGWQSFHKHAPKANQEGGRCWWAKAQRKWDFTLRETTADIKKVKGFTFVLSRHCDDQVQDCACLHTPLNHVAIAASCTGK